MHPEVQAYLARESFDSYLSAIRIIREKELDYPEAVMKCGTYLLKKGGLEDDYWNVVEDVFYAALICQVPDWVKATFKQLQGKHANSKKLNKLKALLFEYQGNFKEALSAYDAILAAEPLDQEAWKRKITLHRSAGKIESAIGELNAYLEIFQSDLEAWAELSDIYLSRQA
jgi:tetratricopeptide (TPR) repeat protein